jgi:hypothetical protein
VLSDQNFSPALPCSQGECLKIIRIENGSLSEIVTCFLDLMKGKEIPAGSVALIFSAAHLQMRGVAGYMADMGVEVARINSTFRGGVVTLPGIPILLGGCGGWNGSPFHPRGRKVAGALWHSAPAGDPKTSDTGNLGKLQGRFVHYGKIQA